MVKYESLRTSPQTGVVTEGNACGATSCLGEADGDIVVSVSPDCTVAFGQMGDSHASVRTGSE